jgi:plasmid stabilization system protein ParE
MGLTVYWTQFAEDKLNDLFVYLSEKASHKLAQKIIGQIIDKSLELEKNQYIGQKEPLLITRINDFRYLVFNNYKIIYCIG